MSSSKTSIADDATPPRPSQSLSGKVAIVTGAGSQGIGIGNGRAAAILLAEAGAAVICSDINLDWAKLTVSMIDKEFGEGKVVVVQADVTNEGDCKRTVELALEEFGRLDILVNNWARGLEINVSSMMLMAKYAIPAMEKNALDVFGGRGSVVNIASIAGLMGGVPVLMYPTSKGAVVNMTRAMAVHHAPMGIRVNCVCPGLLYTPMLYKGGMSAEVRDARRQRSLLKTEGNGWDCGAAVRFLVSERARWITGVALPVDAGATAAVAGSGLNVFS